MKQIKKMNSKITTLQMLVSEDRLCNYTNNSLYNLFLTALGLEFSDMQIYMDNKAMTEYCKSHRGISNPTYEDIN